MTTERPPNDLWIRRNVPTRLTLLPITFDCFEQFKTVGNTSTEFSDLSGLYQTSTVLSRPPTDLTRPFQTIKVGIGRPTSRLSVTGALVTFRCQGHLVPSTLSGARSVSVAGFLVSREKIHLFILRTQNVGWIKLEFSIPESLLWVSD